MNVRKRVFWSLDNAYDNGYFMFLRNPVDEVAVDLVEYDADLEDQDPMTLVPHIEAWMIDRGHEVVR